MDSYSEPEAIKAKKADKFSDSNLIDRIGDTLVYLVHKPTKTGTVTGHIQFQYGPAIAKSKALTRHNTEAVTKALTQWYTDFLIKHKDQAYSFHYIKEVILAE